MANIDQRICPVTGEVCGDRVALGKEMDDFDREYGIHEMTAEGVNDILTEDRTLLSSSSKLRLRQTGARLVSKTAAELSCSTEENHCEIGSTMIMWAFRMQE